MPELPDITVYAESLQAKVQRIVHASNETNYCARCQASGKLLHESWPKHIDDLPGVRATVGSSTHAPQHAGRS